MAIGQEPAALHIPHQGTTEGERGEVRPHRYPDGDNGARTEHVTLARREYDLLALEEPAVDPAVADPQGSGESPKDTSEKGRTGRRGMGKGSQNRQCALLKCG